MSKAKLPIVAIIGRANVGKSSLFNRVLSQPRAVTAREAGTTRDAISEIVTYDNQAFWLVDTAGLKDAQDEFEATIQEQIDEAVASADLLVVVTEAGIGINEDDRKIAKQALKSKKPVVLVVNKADKVKEVDYETYKKFGVKTIVATSATQNNNIDELLAQISQSIERKRPPQSSTALTITIVGRPNVGKSNLFNTLSKKQQAIVADVAGTTRDINRSQIKYHDLDFDLLDTAGIRRSGKIEVGIEKFSVLRTLWAIEQADVCLFVMDVNEHSTKLDQKIAGMIKDAGKGLVVVVSKWDSIEKDAFLRDHIAKEIAQEMPFIPWAPVIFTSAVTGQNVTKLLDLSLDIYHTRQTEIQTATLNKFLSKRLVKHPPAGLKNSHPKLRYMTQTGNSPPSFAIFGSQLDLLHWSYKRFLEREMREEFGFQGTPIKLEFSNNERGSRGSDN